MNIVFFKRQKPRNFSYNPLYYDEKKEELEQVRQKYNQTSTESMPDRMRVQLERSWRNRRSRQNSTQTPPVRILIYLAVVAIMIYFIFFARIF
ncbi:MAG TPA: hypothetical protein VLH16_01520 [Bacteroidales bacterium]|nr:hypothetical protein [Bacteroidales bacterium]